jgi:hypothetical protein
MQHPVAQKGRYVGQLLSYSIFRCLKTKRIHSTSTRRREAMCTRSAGSCCRFVPPLHCFSLVHRCLNDHQVLTGKVPYHYYARDAQVLYAISKEIIPRRPSQALVTDRQWTFMQRCWMPVDAIERRPLGRRDRRVCVQELVEIKKASS